MRKSLFFLFWAIGLLAGMEAVWSEPRFMSVADCGSLEQAVPADYQLYRKVYLEGVSGESMAPGEQLPLHAVLSQRHWATEPLLIIHGGDARHARALCERFYRSGFTATYLQIDESSSEPSVTSTLGVPEAARLLLRDAGLVSLITGDHLDPGRLRDGWSVYSNMDQLPSGLPGMLVVEDIALVERTDIQARIVVLDGSISELVDYAGYSVRRDLVGRTAYCRR
ncbi:hypothetical protein [Isoalcanivorax indicus]|uniref:hypothetical protein n=1 Tax=Isoalcanivorax indicus TaxID=2202653 RepID=UPI0013C4E356|nr:hypothetical protein [Isoalcanivorax indicus]